MIDLKSHYGLTRGKNGSEKNHRVSITRRWGIKWAEGREPRRVAAQHRDAENGGDWKGPTPC